MEEGASSVMEASFWYKGVKVRAKMSSSSLTWKPTSSNIFRCTAFRKLTIRLSLMEVLSASSIPPDRCDCCGSCKCSKDYKFVVYGLARNRGTPCEWMLTEHVLSSSSQEQVKDWVVQINSALGSLLDRPKNLLVFVNPYSGSKKAAQAWETEVLPVFQKARIKYKLIETERQDHARDIVANMAVEELVQYQGIVAVGGDGVFQEVVRGLLVQRLRGGEGASPSQRIRVGHIPAGSTDAVAYSLHGTRSVTTAALHVALGDRLGLDVARIDGADGSHNYFVCQAGYGFMGDVVKWSERFRWLGPSRYELSGAVQFLRLRSYECRVSYKGAAPTEEPHDDAQLPVCGHACEVCRASQVKVGQSTLAERVSSTKSDVAPSPDRSGEAGWSTVEGRFVSIMCVATTCRSDKTRNGIIPHGHLADGRMHLVLVSSCNHLQYLTFLITLARQGLRPGQFNFVHVIPCTSVTVTPIGPESCWNVDGELLPNSTVRINNHRALVDVFARGIEMQPPPLS